MVKKKEIDFRKVNELLTQANEITCKLIDLDDSRRDHLYALRANIDGDIWIADLHNKRVSDYMDEIELKKSELLKQLETVKNQII